MDEKQRVPRHGAPLTTFQESLYEILMGSVAKDIDIDTEMFKNVETILNVYQKQDEILLKNEALRAQSPFHEARVYPGDGMAVRVATNMERISVPVQENIRSIALFLVIFLLLYLQIVQGWIAKESTKAIQTCISAFRWIMMTLLGGYLLTNMMKKTKRTWKRLSSWVEAPMDDETCELE